MILPDIAGRTPRFGTYSFLGDIFIFRVVCGQLFAYDSALKCDGISGVLSSDAVLNWGKSGALEATVCRHRDDDDERGRISRSQSFDLTKSSLCCLAGSIAVSWLSWSSFRTAVSVRVAGTRIRRGLAGRRGKLVDQTPELHKSLHLDQRCVVNLNTGTSCFIEHPARNNDLRLWLFARIG